jgi:hypothetical protein
MSSEGAGDWSPSVMPIVGDLAAPAAVAVVDLDEGLVEVENLRSRRVSSVTTATASSPWASTGGIRSSAWILSVWPSARGVLLVDSIPQGYLPIRFGFTTTSPSAVVVLPVLFEGESLGVIELGSIHSFSPLHLTFLERLVATIGVAIKTIQANRRTEELLNQSQGVARE